MSVKRCSNAVLRKTENKRLTIQTTMLYLYTIYKYDEREKNTVDFFSELSNGERTAEKPCVIITRE